MSVDVLSEINFPEHWNTRPLWAAARRSKEAGQPTAQPLSVFLDAGVVPRDSRGDNHNQLGEDLARYLVVSPGDIVFNKLRTWQGGLGVSNYYGIVSPAYFVCRPDSDCEPRYLHYLLRSSPYLRELTRISKWMPPSQFDTPWETLRRLPIVAPPLEEQRRIADFLDAETSRIRALESSIQRQLELLRDRRSRVLDSSWESTEHGMVRLGYVSALVTSGSRGWGGYVGESGKPFFRSANLRPDSLEPRIDNLVLVSVSDDVNSEGLRARIELEDVLVGITGANAGWVAVSNEAVAGGYVSQHVGLIRPIRSRVDAQWLASVIASPGIQSVLLGSQYGGTKTQLSLPDLRGIRIPNVPIADQRAIAARVTDQVSDIDRIRIVRGRQIELLRERGRSLITAAVTGQFDVSTASGRNTTQGV